MVRVVLVLRAIDIQGALLLDQESGPKCES